jgi:LysR family glycine cleavage system transcriptional activator
LRYQLPSLNALRAVEAVGRHGSISGAAKELRVSPGAVSRQLTLLEAHFNCGLFVRTQRGLIISERGQAYLRQVSEAFDLIDEASTNLLGRSNKSTLSVRAFGTFGTEWLLPRLNEFERKHPEIEITLKAQLKLVDFDTEDADVGIVIGLGNLANIDYEMLCTPHYLPVLSRALLERHGPISSPDDLAKFRLLHSMGTSFGWKDWLDAAGATGVDGDSGHQMQNYSQVYSAMRQGAGVALGQLLLLGDDVISGHLVAPLNTMISGRNGPYYIVWPKRRRVKAEVEAFRSWLIDAVQAAAARQKAALPKLRLIASKTYKAEKRSQA